MSFRQGLCLYIVYTLGSIVFYLGSINKYTIFSLLVAYLFSLPMLFVYSRLLKSKQNIFSIFDNKYIQHIFRIFLLFFMVYVASKEVFNYTYFIVQMIFVRTNKRLIYLFGFIIFYLVLKNGMESLARYSQTSFVLIMFFILIITGLSIDKVNIYNVLPIIPRDINGVLNGVLYYLLHTFLDIFVLHNIFLNVKDNQKIYYLGGFLSFVLITFIAIRLISVIGLNMTQEVIYPLYSSISLIDLDNYITRIESLSIIVYFFSTSTRIIAIVYILNEEFKRLFKVESDSLLAPIIIFVIEFSNIIYHTLDEEVNFVWYYLIISFVALVLFTIILLFKRQRTI